jgi:multidrug efflux pump
MIQYDRGTAARFGITPQLIDNTLYDAFGQRQVSTMYTSLNQYHVVMEASPEFWQNPLFSSQVYVDSPGGEQVPWSAFAKFASTTALLTVTHQGLFPAMTISFNLKPGVALGDAVNAATAAAAKVNPDRIRRHGSSLRGVAGHRADPDCSGAHGGLHHPGDAV